MIYIWHGIDQAGQSCQGKIDSQNVSAASRELNQQNITVFKIVLAAASARRDAVMSVSASSPASVRCCSNAENNRADAIADAAHGNHKINRSTKIKPAQLAEFMQQLAFLINSHVPLVTSLESIAKDNLHLGMRQLVRRIKSDIEAGSSLTAAMRKYPRYFGDLWCNLINTGEKSGTLDTMLRYIAQHIASGVKQKRKVIKALLYPLIVLLIGVIVTAVLLAFVIPQFQEMFANFGAELPVYTQFIIHLSKALQAYGVYLLGSVGALVAGVCMARKRSPPFAHYLDICVLKLPFYGAMLHKVITTNYARILYITIGAGFPLLEALAITSSNISNWRYQQGILKIQEAIVGGCSLHSAMRAQNLFPERVLQLVSLGEEAGNLDNMLDAIANFYADEVDYIIDNLNNLLEPLLMMILGVLVGGLIIGMYLPIFKLGNVI